METMEEYKVRYESEMTAAAIQSKSALRKLLKQTNRIVRDYTNSTEPPTKQRIMMLDGKYHYCYLDYRTYGAYKVAEIQCAKRGFIAIMANANKR